jgi:hypothetical protein
MTGPFETICACGRTTLRPWPPAHPPTLCDRYAEEEMPYLPKQQLALKLAEEAEE